MGISAKSFTSIWLYSNTLYFLSSLKILSKKDEKIISIVNSLKNNWIIGAIFLGRIERAGIYSGFIKIDVASFKDKLLSDDFGFLVLPAEYRKHLVRGEGIEA